MKKYHLLAAVAFVALAACTKNGQTNVPEITDPLEDWKEGGSTVLDPDLM